MTLHDFVVMIARHVPSITLPLAVMFYSIFYFILWRAKPDRIFAVLGIIEYLPHSWYSYSHTEQGAFGPRHMYTEHNPRLYGLGVAGFFILIACCVPVYADAVFMSWVIEANNHHLSDYAQLLVDGSFVATMWVVGSGMCKAPFLSILFFAVTLGIPALIIHYI